MAKLCEKDAFVSFRTMMQDRVEKLEGSLDGFLDRNVSLENYIEVYLPLRVQHQITETVKNSLSEKGQHTLAIVDLLMCEQLRDRVFQDVGHPGMQRKCLEILQQLKLDAQILSKEREERLSERLLAENANSVSSGLPSTNIKALLQA